MWPIGCQEIATSDDPSGAEYYQFLQYAYKGCLPHPKNIHARTLFLLPNGGVGLNFPRPPEDSFLLFRIKEAAYALFAGICRKPPQPASLLLYI